MVLAGLLLLTMPAAAQIKLGDFSSNANGVVSAGYNGSYGNEIDSDHGLSVGGSGTFSGFYYNPNFMTFAVSPYLNQSRDNSDYQSISNASGVNFNSTIFGGSHFPGSINYAKAYNSEGNYDIPGVANYTTHGNSQSFGVSWAELVPGWPTLSASFQMGSSQYSIYGSDDNGSSDNRSFTLRSGYTVKGFNLSGFFTYGDGSSSTPQVLENSTQAESTNSSDHSYGFTVGHSLPWHGGFSSAIDHSEYGADYAGYGYSGTVDTYTATAIFQPTNKFNFAVNTDYSTNLSGSLYQSVAATGGIVPPPNLGQGTHALDLSVHAGYSALPNMQLLAYADHREQYYLGENFGANSYGGGMTYSKIVLGGNFNAAVTLSDNTVSTSSQNSLGLNSTVNFNRRFEDGWGIGVGASYSQNVQTALVTYLTSSYSFGGSVRRRWRKLVWSGGAGVNRTLLTQIAGSSNSNDSFNTALSYSHWITANANYSKSNGTAIEAGAGLVQNPIPQPVIPGNDLILFGGKSYSFGLSSSPIRRLTLGASYAKAITNSNLQGVLSSNDTKEINAIFNYQFRKMYLTGGYSNLVQGFSASGTRPENVSSFYIGVSRWFNFF